MKKIYAYFYVRTILFIKRLGLRFLSKGKNHTRFVVLCSARTGSTWLHTLLNSSLYIHSQGEIVRENHESEKLPFEEFAFGQYPAFIKAVGLKVFYEHPIYQEALDYVLDNPDIKIILITRKSQLEQFVSYKKAVRSGRWSYSNVRVTSKVKVDLKEFTAYQLSYNKNLTELKKRLNNHQVFSMTYEDLVANQERVLSDLQTFLTVPGKKLKSLLKKQSRSPISQQIENWEEIKNQL